jgi:ABC-type nitrate/sulfonate/bicarbonate transport system substrate-binding protein
VTASITPSTDGKYVDVFVPIAFKRFGGRKTIVAPDRTRFLPERSKATDSTLIKALSRAWRWQQLLDAGAYGSIAEMADKEGINRSYLSRTIRLALRAPDIVEAILNGTQPATLQLSDLEQPFPIDWEAQRTAFGFCAASTL